MCGGSAAANPRSPRGLRMWRRPPWTPSRGRRCFALTILSVESFWGGAGFAYLSLFLGSVRLFVVYFFSGTAKSRRSGSVYRLGICVCPRNNYILTVQNRNYKTCFALPCDEIQLRLCDGVTRWVLMRHEAQTSTISCRQLCLR